jgi:hypothetical protein
LYTFLEETRRIYLTRNWSLVKKIYSIDYSNMCASSPVSDLHHRVIIIKLLTSSCNILPISDRYWEMQAYLNRTFLL